MLLKKKKVIYTLGTWHRQSIEDVKMGKFSPLEYLKKTGELKKFKIYQLFQHSLKNKEFHLHYAPSTIFSNYKKKYLNQYNIICR